MGNFKKFEEVCKEKFNDGSFGVLTSIFNPAYPSLKYVFFIFLVVRTIFCLCALGLHDPAIHVEFATGVIAIFFSMAASASFDSYYTERAEFMECIAPVFGISVLMSFILSRISFEEDISTIYYILFIVDVLFFSIYMCYQI